MNRILFYLGSFESVDGCEPQSRFFSPHPTPTIQIHFTREDIKTGETLGTSDIDMATRQPDKQVISNATTQLAGELYPNNRCSLGGPEKRLIGIDNQLAGVEHRVAGIEHRVAGLEHRIAGLEHRIVGLEHRIVGFEHRIDARLNALGVVAD